MTATTWIEDIKRLAAGGGEVTREWLERAEQHAPYCVMPALLFLKQQGVKDNEDVLARLAIAFPDRRALSLLLGDDAAVMADFYPPEASSVRRLMSSIHVVVALFFISTRFIPYQIPCQWRRWGITSHPGWH